MLGELTHAECAYIHDLREVELFKTDGEGLWRRFEHVSRNGNLYPTHGLGPVARYLDIHRGDRFARLVSMSSPSLGLQAYRDRALAPDDPRRKETYACGDVNTSLIQTAKGRTVLLQHDVVSPRPYSRINMVSGTLGTFADYPPRIFFDGASKLAPPRKKGEDEDWLRVEQNPQEAEGGRDRGPLRGRAVEEAREGRREGRARRDGLRDELAPRRVPARGAAARHGRLRRGGVERALGPQRAVGGAGQRAGRVPRLHPGALGGEASLRRPSPNPTIL